MTTLYIDEMKPKKQKSGGARLGESGKKPMMLGWTPEDHDLIRRAAEAERMPMTVFVMRAAIAAARKTIKDQAAP